MDDQDVPGPIDGRCGRKLTSRPGYCVNYPINGGTVCGTHGGKAPQVKAAAARRYAETQITHELDRMGVPVPAGDLHDVLVSCVNEAAGNVLYLRSRVAALEAGITDTVYTEGGSYEVPAVLTKMYAEWVDRLAKLTKMALDAGVDERKIRVTESMGAQIVTVMQGIAAELGYADDPRFPEIAARHLRAVGE